METLSNETELSEEQIRNRADAQVRVYLGGQTVELIGLMPADGRWSESGHKSPCGVCDTGMDLEKIKPAICLKCLRADKKFERVLQAAAKWEQRQFALHRVISEARIKRNAEMQRLTGNGRRNKGPQPGRGAVEASLKWKMAK
jgi:hypothetical protein